VFNHMVEDSVGMDAVFHALADATAWLRFYERHWTERLDALQAMFTPRRSRRDRLHRAQRGP
jgi:hypothetical protein